VRGLNRDLVGYFQGQLDGILSAIDGERSYRRAVSPERVLFDIGEQQELLWQVVSGHGEAATAKAGAQLIADLGLGMTFETENPLVLDFLREKELLVKTIPEELHKSLRAQLVEGNKRGESIADIRRRIEVLYEGVKGTRAETIAQTEIVGAYNVGSMAAMDQCGVTRKMWVATLDDRVRDSHATLHGTVVGITEDFANGLQYPGAPGGAAKEVIRCRCSIAAAT
jgi:SPP1 gp7 family putative phage head morphogenesis protein